MKILALLFVFCLISVGFSEVTTLTDGAKAKETLTFTPSSTTDNEF